MTTISGSFSAPGVSGVATISNAATGITFFVEGMVGECTLTVEQSTDGGTTWNTYPLGVDFKQFLAPEAAGGTVHTPYSGKWAPFPVGQYRFRCVSFNSGWVNWALTT